MAYSTNYSQQSEQKIVLDNFMGFDFSSSKLSTSKNRAVMGKNFINEDGVNKKRKGWTEIVNFGNGAKVNGLWQFVDSEDTLHTLCHCGNKIYEIKYFENQDNSFTQDIIDLTSNNSLIDSTLIDSEIRSYAVVQNNKLFILCGDYLMYVKRGDTWQLERVQDNIDTYIPTTTISIDAVGANDKTSGGLDEVNMLCSRRINTLNVPSNLENTAFDNGITYYLDTPSIDSDEVIVEIQTLQTTPTVDIITTEYKNIKTNGAWGTALYKDGSTSTASIGYIDFNKGMLFLNSREVLKPTFSIAENVDVSDRIKVIFTKKNQDYTDKICKCKFGTLFGLDGATDRLFISGNHSCKNEDFFSQINDFTYFGDQSTAVIGSNTFAITGYSRLGDSTLAIFKQASSQESTIYYRTSTTVQQGNFINAVFPVRSGSIGEGVISPYANCNLSGDNLILSENGVYGIVLSNNVVTDERYARERSRFIDNKLCKEDLTNAVACCYKNKYYLAVNNNCYIADARFKSRMDNDMQDTFNYEWWFWDNIPAYIFAVFENKLYFGTTDGRICVFGNNFVDKSYINPGLGNVLVDYDDNSITINSEYSSLIQRLTTDLPNQKDYISFKAKTGDDFVDLYSSIFKPSDIDKVQDNRIYINSSLQINTILYENQVVYADNVASSGLSLNTGYIIKDIDIDSNSFKLALNEETCLVNKTSELAIKSKITSKELLLAWENEKLITKDNFGNVIDFCKYNNSKPTLFLASFFLNDYVVAEWYTPVLNLGTSEYLKTLRMITVTAETNVSCNITFGWETRQNLKSIDIEGTSLFDFGNIDFNDFTFETSDFTKSFSKKVKEKNFNYIQFRIRSDNDGDCAVNNIVISYVIGKKNKGVN